MNVVNYVTRYLGIVQPGLIAAIKSKDLLERVIVSKMKSNKSGCVLVKLIDKGSEMFIEQADLLHLPRELSEIPPQAVEIYVTSIKPIDNDEYYSEESCTFAKEFLENKDLYGVIQLCIGSTLWIDAVTQRIHHATTNITVFDKNLSVTLLDKNLVDKNVQHVEKLIRLCTGKIDIWKLDVQETAVKKPVAIMRKFSYINGPIKFESLPIIDEDNELLTECTFANIITPNCIFLNNRETVRPIKKMQKEILSLIDSIESFQIEDIKLDDRVLFSWEGEWQRGYVVSISKDDITIFSLDWGKIEKFNMNNLTLKRLPSEYQELPYQSIMCGLHFCNHSSNSYSQDVTNVIKHYCTGSDRTTFLIVRAYSTENVDYKMFSYDNENYISATLDLFKSMKRFSITISNEELEKSDEMLHYVLIRNQNVLPTIGFIHEILPECYHYASRLVRNGSIPHLTSDILCSKDIEKRDKISKTIERIIDKKREVFVTSGLIPHAISAVLHSLTILMHFINDRSIFMSVYRSLNILLLLAYENKYYITDTTTNEVFSIRFVTEILLDYKSTIFHMLRHLAISVRNCDIEECRIILDNFRMMLLDPPVVTAFFENNIWYIVMSSCVGALLFDENVYNLLMDILVQLIMLWENKKSILDDVLTQCCLSFHRSDSPSIWNSSLSLISCFVNLQNYSHVFRNLNFFEIVFDKFVHYYNKIGKWDEFHDNALDILTNMWRNGSANKNKILSNRKLSTDIECISKANTDKTILSIFVTNILLDESFALTNTESECNDSFNKFVPDPDALDWIEGKEISTKNYRKSYNRIYCTSDTDSSSDDNLKTESDSESSDIAVTPFLDSNINPADEDNVPCFEKA